MSQTAATLDHPGTATEHFDVLIVGAGISGVGGAYHLTQQCPGTTFAVLETQSGFGGTWKTHTYPGVRSDSDLFTFGYRFKPWVGAPIASAEEILKYMGEVIEENDLGRHIRYDHEILSATWSSDDKRWTLSGRNKRTGEAFAVSATFLWMCQGYYRHSQGYTPEWKGMDSYRGQVVHPQSWPADIDLTGKNVIVIGSGATAATLVPAIAGACAHVTMLQRTPTYFITGRNADDLADQLRVLDVPDEWVHEIIRRKRLHDQDAFTKACFEHPEFAKQELLNGVRTALGGDEETVAKHFTPPYLPWRQRIAFVPDADLFEGVKSGKASVVTDEIDTWNETGILTKSGQQLDADIIVTATGFDLNVLGDIEFVIDGKPMVFSDTVTYRGTMFTGVPNMAWVFGYFRASWTLRADLIADFVCRLLNHMKAKGATVATPQLRPEDAGMELRPWVDPENFNPGYIQRGQHLLPRQGDHQPWQTTQDYTSERHLFPAADLDDGALRYT